MTTEVILSPAPICHRPRLFSTVPASAASDKVLQQCGGISL